MKSSESAPLTLQASELDLNSPRTQLLLGLCAAGLNCIVSDFPAIENTNFLLHILLTVLIGLIAFEITGLYGNRIGAAPAIWSAFLFSCYPAAAADKAGLHDLFAPFVLLAFFYYQRFRLLKELPYLAVAGGFLILSIITGGIQSVALPLMLLPYELIFRNSPARLVPAQEPDIITPVLTSVRLMLFSTVWLALSFMFQLGVGLKPNAEYPGIMLPAVIFCIFLPLIMLPVSGARDRSQARLISIVSMVLITAMAWGFHNLRG